MSRRRNRITCHQFSALAPSVPFLLFSFSSSFLSFPHFLLSLPSLPPSPYSLTPSLPPPCSLNPYLSSFLSYSLPYSLLSLPPSLLPFSPSPPSLPLSLSSLPSPPLPPLLPVSLQKKRRSLSLPVDLSVVVLHCSYHPGGRYGCQQAAEMGLERETLTRKECSV